MAKVKKTVKETSKLSSSPFQDYWEKHNYIIFIVGIGIVIFGYVLMAKGPWDNPLSLSISPVVLLIAYLIIIPLSILIHKTRKEKNVTREG